MTRRAYRETEAFGLALKNAQHYARDGQCKAAKRAFKEATHMGSDLAEVLPNLRGEIVRKLAMVEGTLVFNECGTPRLPPGVTKRLHRRA